MIGILRLAVIGFAVLTVVYLILSFAARMTERRRLGQEFDADAPPEAGEAERDAYIDKGLAEYEGSLRRRLLLGVYVVPILIVGVLVYVMNFM